MAKITAVITIVLNDDEVKALKQSLEHSLRYRGSPATKIFTPGLELEAKEVLRVLNV